METADLHLRNQLCFALYTAARATATAYRDALAETKLTFPQYLVMLALWENDGLTVSELGTELHLDSGTLSPLLTRLETNGYVTRSRPERDGRRVVVHLTTAGEKLRAAAEQIHCAIVEHLDMPEADVIALRDMASRLTELIEGRISG
ncbi:MarR family winged helix-turn-helix transcriptional regulator [Leucobacter sp. Z1108]|uniref:MarR family winged helix-turn-helix transcriptional regulator n=1 Tax=Leucobacter sp. Z1108 TaxID=3439066 RepID=UPI003F3E36A3